jgi:putative restriction endonuclease
MSTNSLKKYIHKFSHLNVDMAHGPAPHQQVLLLSIIELIDSGQFSENKIRLCAELAATFLKYWPIVTERQPNIAMPFFHLKGKKSTGFWHLHANAGYERELSSARRITSISRLRKLVSHSTLDDELFVLLVDPASREVLRQTLIQTYFPDFEEELVNLIAENQETWKYTYSLFTRTKLPLVAEQPATLVQRIIRIRQAGFRRAIMQLYNYTCAVCELCIVTTDGESATDAAHIIPYHELQNDDLRNGVSLCKLHHWAFDQGLISFSNSHRIVVSRELSEQKPTEWMLTKLGKKRIQLPKRVQHYPAPDAMAWHREYVFENNFIK